MSRKVKLPSWEGFHMDEDYIYPPDGPAIHRNQVESYWYQIELHRRIEEELERLKAPGRQLDLDLSKIKELSVPAGGIHWPRSAVDPSSMMVTTELRRYASKRAANINFPPKAMKSLARLPAPPIHPGPQFAKKLYANSPPGGRSQRRAALRAKRAFALRGNNFLKRKLK